ncbi:MAG: amino acid dehydrogenase [Chlamydiota bacterium]|nr:amino acid dehydrogenase [Chlamydiota bacterium]
MKIKEIQVEGYEKVIEAIDKESNLHCFIAIHNSTLGPALGGTRIYPYNSPNEALHDVLRLSKGMTNKSAAAQLGLGGGKSVIIANPATDKNEKLLKAFAKVVDSLKGKYIAAEDVGSTVEDMTVIRSVTPYVAALPTKASSGDPSRYTSWGVIKGIQATAMHLWGSDSLEGKRVAIQGLGHVGSKLAEHLFWLGADLIVTDTDTDRLEYAQQTFNATISSPEDIFSVDCDIFAPCAMGGIVNPETIPQFKCKAIAGAANNQLLSNEDGELLLKRGILYAPDYIINSGGIINVSVEFSPDGYNPKIALQKVNMIYDNLLVIYKNSTKEHKPTSQVAEELANYNLENKIEQRTRPIEFI